MPAKTFLITTPEHDDTVFYCSSWSQEIIEAAQSRSFNVVNLPKEKANRAEFESRIRKSNPKFVMFNGHGVPDMICGHGDEVLLKTNENEGVTKGRIVYARSCFSLKKLGKNCSKKGAKAFVGYFLPFMFVSDPARSAAHPLKDELAQPCFESSNSIPLTLLKGNSIKDAIFRSKEKTDKLIAYWKTQNRVEASMVVASLMWNKRALGHEGNENAKIS